MPTVTEKPIRALAHCRDPRCDGYPQQEVDAREIVTEQTYRENGGDIPGVERSWVSIGFLNDEDIDCPACGHYREISAQVRPTYQALSGHSQSGLLGNAKFNPLKQGADDPRLAELEAQVKKLTEALGGAE